VFTGGADLQIRLILDIRDSCYWFNP